MPARVWDHEKVANLLPTGWIDRSAFSLHRKRMEQTLIFFRTARSLACLAFAVALVLLPPSASHGSHGEHPYAQASTDHSGMKTAHDLHDAKAVHHVDCGSASDHSHEDTTPGSCCDGMCLSVGIIDSEQVFHWSSSTFRYALPRTQTSSVEPVQDRRPPKVLI